MGRAPAGTDASAPGDVTPLSWSRPEPQPQWHLSQLVMWKDRAPKAYDSCCGSRDVQREGNQDAVLADMCMIYVTMIAAAAPVWRVIRV